MDGALKERIAQTGLDETGFLELSIIRSLLLRGRMNKTEIKKMAEEQRIRPTTVLSLQNEGLLK